MRKLRILFGLFILLSIASAQGIRVDTSFYSQSLEMTREVDIYLPEGYDPDGDIDYPVIYFLHGAGGDQNSYPEIIGILDTLIAGDHISPCIVVKPNGHIMPYAGSMWTNSELYGNFEDYVIYDLIEFVESSYRARAERNCRCITGHSMGGIGSMKIALAHPDIYRAVAALSGSLDITAGMSLWIDHIIAETGGEPPYDYAPSNGTFSLLTFTAAGAFSPDPEKPPYYLDFPIDPYGNIIDSVYNRWLPHNPANMASSLPPDHDLAIYFDCGTYDHLEFLPMNDAFAETLTALNIPYQYQRFFGDHYSSTRPPIAFMFLDSVMNSTVAIDEPQAVIPDDITLGQNYPNPFNARTTIEFMLNKSGHVKLTIYDLLGRELVSLLDDTKEAEYHRISWNAGDYPSGIYFYKLETNSYTITKKMNLLK